MFFSTMTVTIEKKFSTMLLENMKKLVSFTHHSVCRYFSYFFCYIIDKKIDFIQFLYSLSHNNDFPICSNIN